MPVPIVPPSSGPIRINAGGLAYTDSNVPGALCDYAASNLEGTGVVRQYKPTRFADIATKRSVFVPT